MTSSEYQQLVVALNEHFAAVHGRFDTLERRFDSLERRFDSLDHGVATISGSFDRLQDCLDRGLDQMVDRFGAIYASLDRLEQEGHMIREVLRRIETLLIGHSDPGDARTGPPRSCRPRRRRHN